MTQLLHGRSLISLYCYNYSLFSANLNGEIFIDSLVELFPKFRNPNPYIRMLSNKEDYIIDMQAYKNVLFVSTNNYLYKYNLRGNGEINIAQDVFTKEIPKCTRIKIDYENNLLFALSEKRGLVTLDISNPNFPVYKKDLVHKLVRENIITDFDLHNGKIFLAIRDKGIVRLDYDYNNNQDITIISSIDKVSLSDPQDVKYNKLNDYLFIGDYDEGLLVQDISSGGLIFREELPNHDHISKLIIHKNSVIIKGKKGLYYYDTKNKKIITILNQKVGLVTKYYNCLIFSSKKTLNLIFLGSIKKDYVGKALDNPLFDGKYNFINNELISL